MTEYIDFEIRLRTGRDGLPCAEADSVVAGQAEGAVHLPESSLLAIWEGGIPRVDAVTRDLEPAVPAPDPAELGALLYDALLGGELGLSFRAARLARPDAVVRISLRYDLRDAGVQRLAALPWELMRDRKAKTPLLLSRDVTLVRHIHLPLTELVPPFQGSLRILFAMSNVRDDLDLEKEVRLIRQRLDRHADEIETVFEEVGSLADLEKLLHRGGFHVVHFMGHGRFKDGQGALQLGDQLCAGTHVGRTIGRFRETRLVVLNACHTAEIPRLNGLDPFAGVATALVDEKVPAVVAMQDRIADEAAAVFSERLYLEIARRSRIEDAVGAARSLLDAEYGDRRADWAIPVLFMRTRDDIFARSAAQVVSVYERKDVPHLEAFMVDRGDVVRDMQDALAEQERRGGLPLVAITSGAGEAAFDTLAQRMQLDVLARYFARDGDRASIQWRHLTWPVEASREDFLQALSSGVVGAFVEHGTAPIEKVRDHLAGFAAPPLLSFQLGPDAWQQSGGRSALDTFIDYWTGWPRAPAGPRVIVLLGVTYAREQEKRGLRRWFGARPEVALNNDIRAVLGELEEEGPREDVMVCMLPKLGPITEQNAVDWAVEQQRTDLSPEIRRVFREHEAAGHGKTMSMDEASPWLESLLARERPVTRKAS